MPSSKQFLILGIAFSTLISCTKRDNPTEAQVKQSIEENEQSNSLAEWEGSDANPEKLFAKWNAQLISKELDSKMVCSTLQEIAADKLTLFEEQIRFEGNQILLEDCKTQLIETLENYWKVERENLQKLLEKETSRTQVKEELKDTFSASVSTSKEQRPKDRTFFPEVIVKRDTTKGYSTIGADTKPYQVLLTFDDGPHATLTESILKTLDRFNARALFFQKGKNAKAYPEIARRVARDKHSVGSHSYSHACLPTKERCRKSNGGKILTLDQGKQEIRRGHQAVFDVLGWIDPFFRFPYGESSPELKKYLVDKGVGEFYWSIDTNDWRPKSPSDLVKDTMKALRAAKRGNILFHDVQQRTAEALPVILQLMLQEGYDTITLQPEDLNERTRSRLVD